MNKLLVFDFDGTLYAHKDERRMRQTLKDLLKMTDNTAICVASGRPYHLLKNYFLDFPQIYIISNDGALITKNDEMIYENPIDKKIIEDLGDKYEWAAYGECISYLHHSSRRTGIEWMKFFKSHGVYVLDALAIEEKIYKITFKEKVDKISGLTKCYDSYGVTEFVNESASKGEALAYLARLLKIEKKDIISFGDGENDISMFRASGRSYAYKYSKPKVKNSADGVFGKMDTREILERIMIK